jgi:hypothetical protein
MGRSSREKDERQLERSWTTINPWTGRAETFQVRISGKGLRAWERDRVSLRSRGYPDRPPMVDTARIRSWESAITCESASQGQLVLVADPTARAIGSWGVSDSRLTASLNLGRRPDGTLMADVRVGSVRRPGRWLLTGLESVQFAEQIAYKAAESAGLPPPRYTSAEQMLTDLNAGLSPDGVSG